MIAKKFLSHAFENLLLNQVLDHGQPDATYAVGQGLISPSFGALKKYLGKLSEEEFFTRGNDFKNQLSFLKKRRKFIKYEKPSVEEILSLARKGYLPTYLEAYIYAKSLKLPDQGESILNEALEHEYIPALLYKAYLYQDKKDFDHARECYNFFAEAGYFKGYTKLAELNIGDVQKSYQKLQGMTEDQRHFVTDLYMRAAHPNNPEGFLELGKHLVILAKYFSADNQEQKNIHYRDAFEAWYKGFQLGDICCFENAHFILNKNNIKHLLDHSHIESIESNHLMMYEKLIKLIDNFIFG